MTMENKHYLEFTECTVYTPEYAKQLAIHENAIETSIKKIKVLSNLVLEYTKAYQGVHSISKKISEVLETLKPDLDNVVSVDEIKISDSFATCSQLLKDFNESHETMEGILINQIYRRLDDFNESISDIKSKKKSCDKRRMKFESIQHKFVQSSKKSFENNPNMEKNYFIEQNLYCQGQCQYLSDILDIEERLKFDVSETYRQNWKSIKIGINKHMIEYLSNIETVGNYNEDCPILKNYFYLTEKTGRLMKCFISYNMDCQELTITKTNKAPKLKKVIKLNFYEDFLNARRYLISFTLENDKDMLFIFNNIIIYKLWRCRLKPEEYGTLKKVKKKKFITENKYLALQFLIKGIESKSSIFSIFEYSKSYLKCVSFYGEDEKTTNVKDTHSKLRFSWQKI
ncbi:hypothetical protein A3Q56_04515, partial [Intoshia linei]